MGRYLVDYDVDNRNTVAVIGKTLKESVFGNEEGLAPVDALRSL